MKKLHLIAKDGQVRVEILPSKEEVVLKKGEEIIIVMDVPSGKIKMEHVLMAFNAGLAMRRQQTQALHPGGRPFDMMDPAEMLKSFADV